MRSLPLEASPFVQGVKEKLKALPLKQVQQKGIWRKRDGYYLNISYPSMQAMEPIKAGQVFTKVDKREGKDVALYIHVPFCTAECYYCHYYKEFGKSSQQVDTYISSVLKELRLYQEHFAGIRAKSIYIGGGTPSYMSSEQIDRLFTAIEQYVTIPKGIEISFEVHPESGTEDKLAVLAMHKVNRINVGVESFDNRLLTSEHRRHTAEQAEEIYQRIKSRFPIVNLDFIYGLKGQTVAIWEETLNRLATLLPASTTMYFLRIKRGTPEYNLWKKYPSQFPSDDDLLLMHAMNFEKMEGELGYTQSPVDWYIKEPSYFHTYQDYNWRRSDEVELLGLGASAYSYINGWQYYNVNDTRKYQESITAGTLAVWKGEKLTGDEKMRRTVMLGIKMGINRESFERTYGIDVLSVFPRIWERLYKLKLIELKSHNVKLSYIGKLFADEVGQQFYSDKMRQKMLAIDPALVSTTWPQFNP